MLGLHSQQNAGPQTAEVVDMHMYCIQL